MTVPIFGIWPPGAIVADAMNIGAPVGGGLAPSILFVGAANKLDQDPTHFAYDKATRQFTLSSCLQNIDRTQADGNAQTPFARVRPAVDPGPLVQPSYTWLHERALFGTTYDHIIKQGWNLPNSPDYDPTRGSVWDSWEFDVELGPLHNERHIAFQAPGGPEVRPLTIQGFFGGTVEVAHEANLWDWELPGGTPLLTLDTTGLAIRTLRKLYLYDSTPAKKLALGFDVGQFQLGDPTTELLVLNNLIKTNNSIFVGDPAGAATHEVIVYGNTGKYARLTTAVGTAQLVSDQALIISGDNATHFPVQIAAGDVALAFGAGTGVFIGHTLDATVVAGADPVFKMNKTAIVPVGALVYFKVQDETGATFYLPAQAA